METLDKARYGALQVRDGAGQWQALQAGTSGQILKTKGEENPEYVTLGVLRKATITPTIGASLGVYGTAIDFSPTAGWLSLLIQAITMTVASIGAETVTIRATVTFSDTTTAIVTHDFTANGDYELTLTELLSLMKDAVSVTKISIDSKSTIDTSGAVTSANIGALNL